MYSFGGEMEYRHEGCNQYITDSGRSSLRLLFASEELQGKKFLLPDYICSSILTEFKRAEIEYDFYHINDDLSIDISSIKSRQFDVLYIINYFGRRHNVSAFTGQGLRLIEDNRFMLTVTPRDGFSAWAGFNSFRKVTPSADGSVLLATFNLPKSLINTRPAPFSRLKYEAKEIKYDYVKHGEFSEEDFLSKFREGEEMVDEQQKIYQISERGALILFNFFMHYRRERNIRKRNYRILTYELGHSAIKLKTRFPSFFILSIDQRDELREHLFAKNIFLPIHWTYPGEGPENELYSRCLSIPVDSRYDADDMIRVATKIRNFLEEN